MKRMRLLLAIVFPLLLLGLFLTTWQTKASPSATFIVNSSVDAVDVNLGDGVCETAASNGICTLRAAVMEANALPGTDSITLPTGIYELTIPGSDFDSAVGDLNITESLTINGNNAENTIIDGNLIDRVIDVRMAAGQAVTINNVTIQNGEDSDFGVGICHCSVGSFLTLSNVIVRNNTSFTSGAGIWNSGQITITNSSVYNNTASSDGGGIVNFGEGIMHIEGTEIYSNTADFGGVGGGIYNTGIITISTSSVYNNSVIADGFIGGVGGGIANNEDTFSNGPGSAFVFNSIISNNSASSAGSDYYNIGGTSSLINVTISENTLSNSGSGGGFLQANGVVTITNATIVHNTASTGAGIRISGGSFSIGNSIVSSNSPGSNCNGSIVSNGFNLDSGNSCNFVNSGDIINTAPMLGPLLDNGGPTLTYALLVGSPAIDAASNILCPTTDQRGTSRPIDGDTNGTVVCDIGAYEFESSTPDVALSVSGVATAEGQSGLKPAQFLVSLSQSASLPITVTYSTANGAATAGNDYVATSGNLVFAIGETEKTVSVMIIGDTKVETDETFFLNLSNAQNVVLESSQGTGTILNDDYSLYLPTIIK